MVRGIGHGNDHHNDCGYHLMTGFKAQAVGIAVGSLLITVALVMIIAAVTIEGLAQFSSRHVESDQSEG